MNPPAPPRRQHLAWLAVILLAVLAIYLPSLGNLLVFDDGYLADGGLFADYRSPLELRARMLSYGSFVWLHLLFGEGWWKQRLFNVLLHCGVVVSLWALYREILRHIAMPAEANADPVPYPESPALHFAIGFFALNPVSVYAVAYLIQRSILMATLFTVVALWAFARGLRTRKWWLHAVAILCYALAIMSKEHAILVPLAAIPLYLLVARPPIKRLALFAATGAMLIGVASFLLWRRYGEILGKPFDEYSRVYLAQLAGLNPRAQRDALGLSIENEAYLFFHYGLRWLFPFAEWMSINLRPPFPVTWATFPHLAGAIAYVGVVIGGFAQLLRHRDWRALVAVSVLMPALLFATEFGTVWVQDPFVLYRSYLWAIGIPGLVFFVVHGPSARIVATIGLVVATFLTWQSLDRVMSLATPEAAWTDAIAKLPNDPRSVGRWFPYLNRGAAYVDGGQYALAMRDFEASSRLGDMGMGTFNMGSLLAASGRHAEALAAFDRAEKEGYDVYNLPFQRGLSLAALGRFNEAYDQFNQARLRNPPSPMRELVLLNQGKAAMQVGMPQMAVIVLREAAASDPRNREAKQLLGMSLVMVGDPAHAKETFDELLSAERSSPAYYGRALANYALKRKADALADIDQAIRLGGANANLQQWRQKIQALP